MTKKGNLKSDPDCEDQESCLRNLEDQESRLRNLETIVGELQNQVSEITLENRDLQAQVIDLRTQLARHRLDARDEIRISNQALESRIADISGAIARLSFSSTNNQIAENNHRNQARGVDIARAYFNFPI